jgi:predicted RNase H-like HicB family nuclease
MSIVLDGRLRNEVADEVDQDLEPINQRTYDPELPVVTIEAVADLAPELPMQLVDRYARAAMHKVEVEQIEDGTYFATHPDLEDVWAQADTEQEALAQMFEIISQWVIMKIEAQDRDLPLISGIDLNKF